MGLGGLGGVLGWGGVIEYVPFSFEPLSYFHPRLRIPVPETRRHFRHSTDILARFVCDYVVRLTVYQLHCMLYFPMAKGTQNAVGREALPRV